MEKGCRTSDDSDENDLNEGVGEEKNEEKNKLVRGGLESRGRMTVDRADADIVIDSYTERESEKEKYICWIYSMKVQVLFYVLRLQLQMAVEQLASRAPRRVGRVGNRKVNRNKEPGNYL